MFMYTQFCNVKDAMTQLEHVHTNSCQEQSTNIDMIFSTSLADSRSLGSRAPRCRNVFSALD